ncbi:Galactose mutarotase [Cnuella takakiae]|uniref:Galactose mutarotase n=1 Tax=Cnuella takakiae TaxID=1302690 RepID=A0A1M5D6Z3_9BACT|nr:aldose 1-epimerase family protein [Cnuella takakiae]OLY94089.1 aldose epimerase [Cnuella takakiae]SHF62635.1 Galactose mutarotase [Cnuella takakiae]
MYTLENEILLVNIVAKGAELTRIYHKQHQLEYLWDARPEVWGKHSPVLFPIVGTLKENTFFYEGQAYQLSRHGFARDREFEVSDQSANSIRFTLRNDETTAAVFPFAFVFSLTYKLEGNRLAVSYQVSNPDTTKPLYFSVGAHPAFRLPLEPGLAYEDYRLVFNKAEHAGRWPITQDGLIDTTPQALLENTSELPLHKELFAKDALVLKHLQSDSVTLRTEKSERGLQFDFPGFPFLGLWAAPGADFLCIEPWCGIADSVTHNQQWTQKEGIIHLPAGANLTASWSVSLF